MKEEEGAAHLIVIHLAEVEAGVEEEEDELGHLDLPAIRAHQKEEMITIRAQDLWHYNTNLLLFHQEQDKHIRLTNFHTKWECSTLEVIIHMNIRATLKDMELTL